MKKWLVALMVVMAGILTATAVFAADPAPVISGAAFTTAFQPIIDTVVALLVPGLGIMATLFAVYMVPRIFKHFAHGA